MTASGPRIIVTPLPLYHIFALTTKPESRAIRDQHVERAERHEYAQAVRGEREDMVERQAA